VATPRRHTLQRTLESVVGGVRGRRGVQSFSPQGRPLNCDKLLQTLKRAPSQAVTEA
jgi:hypothetical protein